MPEPINEYPPEGRFGWDLVFDAMTPKDFDDLADCVDVDDLEGAEAVVARAEARVFHGA